MTQEDIDATKAAADGAPDRAASLIIRSLTPFRLAFIVCFYFSRTIYNILTLPYVRVVGAEKATRIATHFLEQFYTNIRLYSMFGAGVIALPVIAVQLYMFIALRASTAMKGRLSRPYPIATPIFFLGGALLVYFAEMSPLIRFSQCRCSRSTFRERHHRAFAQGQRISRSPIMTLDLRGLDAFLLSGDPDPARSRRQQHPAYLIRMRAARSPRGVGIAADLIVLPDLYQHDLARSPDAPGLRGVGVITVVVRSHGEAPRSKPRGWANNAAT